MSIVTYDQRNLLTLQNDKFKITVDYDIKNKQNITTIQNLKIGPTKNIINNAIKTFNKAKKKMENKIYIETGHITRALTKYTKTVNLEINLLENDFVLSLTNIEYSLSVLYPDIDKYILKIYKDSFKPVIITTKDNIVYINGPIINVYHLLLSRYLIILFNNIRNSSYSIDEYLSNIKHEKCNTNSIDTDCIICLESFKKNDIVSTTNCGHKFHYHCLYSWLINSGNVPTCPHCRKLQTRCKSNIDLNIL